MPTPFRVHISEAEIEDLRARLRATRWSEPETVEDWSQGMPLTYAQELAAYWAEDYDMRRVERELNARDQSIVEVDGLGIHVLQARSPHPGALPLLLTHGWPGSVIEFLDILDLLTEPPDPADAFHVVCPTLPGFGFSAKPTRHGWGVQRIGAGWAGLMAQLGYGRYGAHGGDWGSFVTAAVGAVDPEHCVGVHMTLPRALPVEGAPITEREQAGLAATAEFRNRGSGYSAIQSTRPQTVGYGLVDSPTALLCWIVDKFWAWTDHDGDLEQAVGRDRLLDNVMLYWLPAAGASSARIYWESYPRHLGTFPVAVPAGASVYPKEVAKIPRAWAQQRFSDLRYWNDDLPKGGHFASMEVPESLGVELRTFFGPLR
jgi:pimeloyl-ACP methyl ester carboxylesterase